MKISKIPQMEKTKIRTSVTISSAHFVQTLPDSPCKRLHGHNWRIDIEIVGQVGENGVIVDFQDLKNIAKALDHKTLLPDIPNKGKVIGGFMYYGNQVFIEDDVFTLTGFNVVTSENIAKYIAREIQGLSQRNMEQIKVTVFESENSSATHEILWYAR